MPCHTPTDRCRSGAANGLMAEVLESHIRETFDRNDCYSREVSQSVDDTIELVRAYLK
ncbi:regulator protein FrmR [Escherichia coli]|uniref:Regulator protein FrmR n=1 Tax=Escherichia coli TaxID=562 RepID=A0A376KZF4_ECOLX|nr:regulator protein FrmR [Escherichia coli]VFS03713.1 regulator protein FrmR [Escherichia coli]